MKSKSLSSKCAMIKQVGNSYAKQKFVPCLGAEKYSRPLNSIKNFKQAAIKNIKIT